MFKSRRDLPVLLAYFLLTLVLTYPLILHFTTHVAGDGGDDPALAWNLWWVKHALFDLGTSPIYTDYMFYPIGLNLGFYTLTYLNAFLSIPIQFVFGIVPAANLNLFLSFTLSGFGTYLLVTYLLRRALSLRGAGFAMRWTLSPQSPTDSNEPSTSRALTTLITLSAFIAGLVYAFSSNKFLYASLGQFNIASSQWIPFYILFLLKIFDSPKPPLRYGVLLGFFLLAQALSEFIFASFLILFTFAYLIYWLISIRFQIKNHISKIINLALAAVLFTLAMSPILGAMFSDLSTEGDFIQQGLGFSNIFSADLLGFFVPSHLHPLFGNLVSLFAFPYINFMYLGFTAIVLALIALWKIKPARIWGLWFALIALVTLGPTLRINGAEWDLPLPFDLLLDIPLIKGNRYPSRWSVMLTLCLAVLVGYGIAYCLSRIANRRWRMANGKWQMASGYAVLAIFAFLILFEHLSIPLPLSDFQIPQIYSQIAQDTGNFSVMELPLAWRNGFRVTGSYRQDSQTLPDAIFMLDQWYQTAQQHPILNGNTSRNPELKFQYFEETPVLNSLLAIQTGHEIDDPIRAQDRALAPRLLQFFGTRYIVWHTPLQDENRNVAEKTRAYVEETFPVTKISEVNENGHDTVVYRVNALPPVDSLDLKPNDPLARLYLGEGWGAVGGDTLWQTRNFAKIFVPLTTPRDMDLTLFNFQQFDASGDGILVNDTFLPTPLHHVGDNDWGITIPAALLHSGMNKLYLGFRPIHDTSRLNPSPSVVVRSAGEEQGAFGHIYLNGVDESPNGRGYNIVVIDPANQGTVITKANFETFASEQESDRMAKFIVQIPDGSIVAVAASDDASYHLTQVGVDALASLGAKVDLRGKFRWSHALIAAKGNPATAREAASEIQVSQLIQGAGITEPTISATFSEIRLEPTP